MISEIINLYKENKLKEANFLCEKLILEKKLNFDELLIICNVKIKIKDFLSAIKLAQDAINLQPNNYIGYNDLAIALKSLGNYDLAIKNYEKALKINPKAFQVYNNLGLLYKKINKFNNAVLNFKNCLNLNPNYSEAHTNLATVYYEKKFYKLAKFHFNTAINLNPKNFLSHWNLSLLLLEVGKFNEGWHYYEYGKKCGKRPNPEFKYGKLWDGIKNLNKKKILIYSEQGLGDTIQFCRYIKLIKSLGCEVIFQTYENLKYLLKDIDGIDKIICKKEEVEQIDYYCSLLSLPILLSKNNLNIINVVPYISIPNDNLKNWEERLNFGELKIGICCNAKKTDQNFRSFNISCLKKISKLKNLKLISLEKNSNYKKTFANILEIGDLDNIIPFRDTAAIISKLDLIITCDTVIAHLAGALNKKTLLLLNYKSDWRWGVRKNTTLWYPSFQLFRNKKQNNWKESFEKIFNYLKINYNVNYK